MGSDRSARSQDFRRHLEDLKGRSYEGASDRPAKEQVFRAAVELLAPVVARVLASFNDVMLLGAGSFRDGGVQRQADGALIRQWELSWPGQQSGVRRLGGTDPIAPIIVRAHFAGGWTHGHLGGDVVGNWPLQIVDAADADRQAEIVWAIAEAELHERIFETKHPWEAVPLTAEEGR